ncbi:MAG: universal stress protein [Mucilaginibacter sp.]|nr:universal stress protein [Mucilaginibacter sp.]
MKTLLIPVDFSEISGNMLRYIVGFAADAKVERIILLKSAYISIYAELLPSADFVQLSADDIIDERKKTKADLDALCHKLLKKLGQPIKINIAVSELPLLRAIHQVIDQEHPYMVLLGSDKTVLENDSYMAEQIIAIAKTSTVPVLIVPDCVTYEKIELALVPCDFAVMAQLEALLGIHDRKNWLHPRLIVLNTNLKKQVSEKDSQVASVLARLLADYRYQVFQAENKDTVKGILEFADEHKVHLIIALPGRYSFFYNLTHRNITNALALNAAKPVLILK